MTEWKIEDYDLENGEEQIADTDTKAILLGIHSELQHIRIILSRSQSRDSVSSADMVCRTCGEQYATEAAMRGHAQRKHNAPTDRALDDLIEP